MSKRGQTNKLTTLHMLYNIPKTYENAILITQVQIMVQIMKINCEFNTYSLAKGSFSVLVEQTDTHKAC